MSVCYKSCLVHIPYGKSHITFIIHDNRILRNTIMAHFIYSVTYHIEPFFMWFLLCSNVAFFDQCSAFNLTLRQIATGSLFRMQILNQTAIWSWAKGLDAGLHLCLVHGSGHYRGGLLEAGSHIKQIIITEVIEELCGFLKQSLSPAYALVCHRLLLSRSTSHMQINPTGEHRGKSDPVVPVCVFSPFLSPYELTTGSNRLDSIHWCLLGLALFRSTSSLLVLLLPPIPLSICLFLSLLLSTPVSVLFFSMSL